MCNNGYSPEQRRYFDDLAHIGVRIIEGADIVDAAAEKNMTADEFKKALSNDVRKVNFPAYLQFSHALFGDDTFRILLKEEMCSNTEAEDFSYRLISCIERGIKIYGEKSFWEFVESQIRFSNYKVYLMVAKHQGYEKLAP